MGLRDDKGGFDTLGPANGVEVGNRNIFRCNAKTYLVLLTNGLYHFQIWGG